MSHRSTPSIARYAAALVTAALLLAPAPLTAGTIAVDVVVGTGSPASCTSAALTAAVATGGVITFNCGAAPHTIVVTSTLTLNSDTLIDGGGLITLNGTDPTSPTLLANPLIRASYPVSSTLRGITITRAAIGIIATGRMTVERVRLSDHALIGMQTGSVFSSGQGRFTLIDSTVTNNKGGGLAINFDGMLVMTRTNVFANGGTGITLAQLSRASMRDSAIFSNTTSEIGLAGGINTNGPIELANVSIYSNTGVSYGGIALATAGFARFDNVTLSNNYGGQVNELSLRPGIEGITVTASNTTVVNDNRDGSGTKLIDITPPSFATVTLALTNTVIGGAAEPLCAGRITSFGGNASTDSSCQLLDPRDQTNIATGLGPLQLNSGVVPVHIPVFNSPLVDRGIPGCSPTDARGTARPQGPACDIGAFERIAGQAALAGILSSSPQSGATIDSGALVTVTARVTNTGFGSANSTTHTLTLSGSPDIVSIAPSPAVSGSAGIIWQLPLIVPEASLPFTVVLRAKTAPIGVTQSLTATNATSVTIGAPLAFQLTQRLIYLPLTLRNP